MSVRLRILAAAVALSGLAVQPFRFSEAREREPSSAVSSDSVTVVATHELDVDLHRRAVEILEEARHLEASPWADARLSREAVALYRPGEARPGYVEIGVEGASGEPRGFLVLSTGEHDAPLIQAAFDGQTPTARLRARAKDAAPAKYYRLGHTYVAVDANGRMIAEVGRLPGKLVGYDASWLDLEPGARRGSAHWDDASGYRESLPQTTFAFGFDDWPSWSALVAGYATNRAPLHERDRRAARAAWEAERSLRANGETLEAGQFRELPLLPRGGVRYQVQGAGAQFVGTVLAERELEGDTVLRVFVEDVSETGVHPVDIDVRYGDGTREALRLNVTQSLPRDVMGAPTQARRPGDPAPPPGTGGSTVREVIAPLAAPGLDCRKVAFEAVRGNGYLRLSGTSISGDGNFPDGNALFTVDYTEGGRINLRAANGKWVRAVGQGGGEVRADAASPTAEATFYIFEKREAPGWYGLQTNDRTHFLVAHHGKTVDARAKSSRWSSFRPAYCEPTRLQSRWAGSSFDDAWSKVRKYNQLPPHTAPSTSQCASGCGGTAWAMLFGFHDYEASLGIPKWAPHTGLYRRDGSKSGPDEVAPEWFRDHGGTIRRGIANVVWEISSYMNDWSLAGCAPTGEKWTAPIIMGRAHKYLEGRVSGLALGSNYDGAMIFTHEGKTNARKVILQGQPVVIGMHDPLHYPLAFGWLSTKYRVWDRGSKRWSEHGQREHFVVHMGHEERAAEMVPYDTWFQGWLRAPEVAHSKPATPAPQPQQNTPSAPLPTPTKPLPKLPANPKPLPNLPPPQPIWK